MIEPMTLTELVQALPESLAPELHNGDASFSQVSIDTRTAKAADLFVALRGERFDAHQYLDQALEQGVCALVVEQHQPALDIPQLVVHDTVTALGHIAACNRARFKKPLIAITGSSGKTTVKTMLSAILAQRGPTLATRGNLNNHIGVPLTLLELGAEHEYAVIEMGASAVGEIAYLCELASPDVALINNVMPAHVEGFGSLEAIANAKGEIYSGLREAGTAVINLDDAFAPRWRAQMAERNVLGFSLFEPGADCRAEDVRSGTEGQSFTLAINNEEGAETVQVNLRAPGEHNLRNALAAASCALAVGATLEQIKQGLASFAPVAGRLSQARGYAGALIIDDSYNANPGSVRAAIDVLGGYTPQRLLVLGDMGELGDQAEEMHREVGRYARESGIEKLFTLGPLSAHASEAFGSAAQSFRDHESLLQALKTAMDSDTKVLVKGSRSANMDLVVRGLSETGEQK